MTSQAVPDNGVEIRLASRPSGWPTHENFDVVEAPVSAPGANQILVRNKVMSADPAMPGRMNDAKSYVPPCLCSIPVRACPCPHIEEQDCQYQWQVCHVSHLHHQARPKTKSAAIVSLCGRDMDCHLHARWHCINLFFPHHNSLAGTV